MGPDKSQSALKEKKKKKGKNKTRNSLELLQLFVVFFKSVINILQMHKM